MRDWGVNPKFLCRKHLLGNHVELHMAVGCILKYRSLKKYVIDGLLSICMLRKRHDQIVTEMTLRGMKHKTELLPFEPIFVNKYESIHHINYYTNNININKNLKELARRCPGCRKRIEKEYRIVYVSDSCIRLFKRR
jgi:hypothetical protein